MIRDDPIIRCMEATGYAPWDGWMEEDPDEHDDYWGCEPFAVYEPEDRDYDNFSD